MFLYRNISTGGTEYLELQYSTHPGSPLEPQFEDVVMSATLDHFVSGVVADVVALVGLEEIVGRHLVTADEQSLKRFI